MLDSRMLWDALGQYGDAQGWDGTVTQRRDGHGLKTLKVLSEKITKMEGHGLKKLKVL